MRASSLNNIIKYSAVAALLIFFHYIGVLPPVESAATKILNPVFKYFYSASAKINSVFDSQSKKTDLLDETKKLKELNEQLIVENSKLKMLDEENKILREHLNFLTAAKPKLILANIISRGEDLQPQVMSIDKGLSNGLYKGLAVLNSNGIIIGKIFSIKDNISEIYLTTSPSCKLAAMVQNKNKTAGIVEGDLGLTMQMKLIPQTEEIKIGDTIVTSGLEQSVPRGLLIGTVASVNRENNELWQSATIEPIADINELSIVSILLP